MGNKKTNQGGIPIMKKTNEYGTVRRFIAVMRLVIERPGAQQVQIAQALRLDKAIVSRLCRQGVDAGMLECHKRKLFPGPVFEGYAKGYLNVEM